MKRTPSRRPVASVLALALVAVLVAGCGLQASQTGSEESQSDSYSGVVPVQGETPVAPETDASAEAGKDDVATGVAESERLIIRTKTLRLEVASTADAIDEIRELAKAQSGVVTDMQVATDTEEWLYRYDEYGAVAGDGTALRGWITVRVPADTFDAFIDAASELGTVKYQSEAADDVTQEHVDMTARLENLRAEEARLREFFDAAKNVTEMLAIEQELARVRGEIESLDAQVKYLERQAAMATVTIELTEDKPVVRPEGESWGFVEAITDGIRGAARVLTFALSFIIATSPLWIAALLIFFVVRAFLRRRKVKRGEGVPASTAQAGDGLPASGPAWSDPASESAPSEARPTDDPEA